MEYIIVITVYLLSVWLVWRYMRIAHSKGGNWENLDIKLDCIFLVITPYANTVFVILWYLFYPPKKNKNRNFNNLFKVKK
jgi:hypothetical protein